MGLILIGLIHFNRKDNEVLFGILRIIHIISICRNRIEDGRIAA